jgi:apolipoprotein N-acyltransferase
MHFITNQQPFVPALFKVSRLVTFLYAVAAGIFFSFAFPPTLLPGIEWVAIAPFLGLLLLPISKRALFFHTWLAATVSFVCYLWWFFDLLPLDWAGVPTTGLMVVMVASALLLTSAWFALAPATLLTLARRMGSANLFLTVCIVFVGWPIFEYIRTASYSVFPFILGPGNIIGDHMAFMLLGYSIIEYPFVRGLAPFLGSYGVSIIALLPNLFLFTCVSYWLQRRDRSTYHLSRYDTLIFTAILGGLFATAIISGQTIYRTNSVATKTESNVTRIALLQTDIPPDATSSAAELRWEENQSTVRKLSKEAIEQEPDILVFPEGIPSIFETKKPTIFDKKRPRPYPTLETIQQILGDTPYRLIVDNAIPPLWFEHRHNTTALLDNHSGVVGVYHKRFLMPFGEYTPHLFRWISRTAGVDWDTIRNSYTPGETPGVFSTPIGTLNILTCSELLSQQFAREIKRKKVDMIILSSSTAILHGSPQLHAQLLAIATLHAAALNIPILYASNGGHSFAIGRNGETLWRPHLNGTTVGFIDVPIQKR